MSTIKNAAFSQPSTDQQSQCTLQYYRVEQSSLVIATVGCTAVVHHLTEHAVNHVVVHVAIHVVVHGSEAASPKQCHPAIYLFYSVAEACALHWKVSKGEYFPKMALSVKPMIRVSQ